MQLWVEMRQYLPSKHRHFLEFVSELPSLRVFVDKHRANAELVLSYDNCLEQLRSWRGKHIAVKYIIQPARLTMNSDVETEDGLQGTGGSALIFFLTQSRDETIDFQIS